MTLIGHYDNGSDRMKTIDVLEQLESLKSIIVNYDNLTDEKKVKMLKAIEESIIIVDIYHDNN